MRGRRGKVEVEVEEEEEEGVGREGRRRRRSREREGGAPLAGRIRRCTRRFRRPKCRAPHGLRGRDKERQQGERDRGERQEGRDKERQGVKRKEGEKGREWYRV